MKALSFNNWNMITEAIIDWQSHGGLKEFYDDVVELITLYTDRARIDYLEIDDLKAIGDHNGIEIVTYDEFLDELPEEVKHTAPPRRAGLFALVNPNTGGPRVVVAIPRIDKRAIDHIYHMLKHEVIHIEQFDRRPDDIAHSLPDPSDQEAYFSNKDEVMAFSHSIADMLVMSRRHDDVESAMNALDSIRLYHTIKKNVNSKTLKRYHKYIYMYLQNEINGRNN
jgi:hypothetical protein